MFGDFVKMTLTRVESSQSFLNVTRVKSSKIVTRVKTITDIC